MQLKVPWILKPFSPLIKSLVKRIIYFRLRFLPLSYQQAEWWANVCKQWPAIFNEPFCVKRKIGPGLLMELGIIDAIQRTLLTQGKWDADVEKILQKYLNRGDIFLDIGANIGYFSLLASGLVGKSGKVIAFEPSLRALEKLTTNLRLNRCQNVILFSIGAGEFCSLKTLYLTTQNNIGGTTLRSIGHSVGEEIIPVMQVGDILETISAIPKVVKIDVEGAELSTLKGMKNILEEHHPVVICELVEEFLQGFSVCMKDVLVWMEALGYSGYLVEEDKDALIGHPISSFSTEFPSSEVNIVFTKERPKFPVENYWEP